MGKKKFKKVEIDEKEITQLIERVETRSLNDGDYKNYQGTHSNSDKCKQRIGKKENIDK